MIEPLNFGVHKPHYRPRYHRPNRRPCGTIWARRMTKLIRAMQWTRTEQEKYFGYKRWELWGIQYRRKRPRIAFVLALAKLEKAYAKELASFEKNHRPLRRRRTTRPQDLKALGAVGDPGSRNGVARGVGARPDAQNSPRTGSETISRGTGSQRDQAVKVGRSEVDARGFSSTAGGSF